MYSGQRIHIQRSVGRTVAAHPAILHRSRIVFVKTVACFSIVITGNDYEGLQGFAGLAADAGHPLKVGYV